jgi:hypothetical protein
MNARQKLRAMMAYHEASHAVVARVLGIECQGVLMFSPEGGAASGALTSSAAYLARDADQAAQLIALGKDITVAYAGPCGERKHRRPSKKYPDQWKSDYETAQTMAACAALVATGVDYLSLARNPDGSVNLDLSADQIAYTNDLMRQCRDAAIELVDEYWPAIERVAQALMTCDLLDQADLDRLIASSKEGVTQ